MVPWRLVKQNSNAALKLFADVITFITTKADHPPCVGGPRPIR